MLNITGKIITTAGLLIIRGNAILLAYSRNRDAWYLPGGKIEQGETPLDALRREILEELNIQIDETLLQPFPKIIARAYGEEVTTVMHQVCFLYELRQRVRPWKEIIALKYFTYHNYLEEPAQVEGVLKAFEKLSGMGLIDKILT